MEKWPSYDGPWKFAVSLIIIQKCISISRVGRVGGPPFSSLLLLTTTGKVIRFPGTALNSEFAVSDLLVLDYWYIMLYCMPEM